MSSNLPDFVIIGMPKAGTSSLHEALHRHPHLCGCRIKEPHYWSRMYLDGYKKTALGKAHGKRLPTTIEAYESLFENCESTDLRFESSVYYVYDTDAADRIMKQNPDCKAILILREPTAFVTSYYQELVSYEQENLAIEQAYSLSGVRTEDTLPQWHTFIEAYNYRHLACPVEEILYWNHLFQKNLLIKTFDELINNWPEVRKEILKHIGVADAEITLPHSNPTSKARLRSLSVMIERLPLESFEFLGHLRKPLSTLYRRLFFPKGYKPEWKPARADFTSLIRDLDTKLDLDLSKQWKYTHQ